MTSAKSHAYSRFGPTADEISLQVDRILASDEFHAAKRGRSFLQFVVDETLAGRSDFLKAFTIANVVFGREASFDPQNDPVVRIEAGRIRKALERYYLVAGQADDVIITVPKGGYVPHFEYTASTPSPLPQMELAKPQLAASHGSQPYQDASRPMRPTLLHLAMTLAALLALGLALAFVLFTQRVAQPPIASGPKVIVEPFAESDRVDTGADIARGLRDDIIGQLTRFDDLVVVADPLRSEGAADANFALQGNVQLDGNRLRASARLVRQSDGAVVWANNFDADLRTENKLIIQGHISRQIANAIAEPYGIDRVVASPAREGDQSGYTCTLAYYGYRQNMTDQNHDLARDCLQNATARFPDNAASWAQLSIVYLDEIRFRYQLRAAPSPQSLELATAAVNRAVALAPASPRTLQALMMVSFFRGDIDKALEAGTAAHAANPDDVEVAGEYGFRLAMSGKWQSGCELLSIALNRGVGTKGYYEVGMALCRLMNGDTEGAEQWARRSDLASNPMHHLVLLSILGTAGKTGEARLERDWLDRHAPALMTNIRQELSLRLQRQEDQARFIDGLRAAGVDIPPAAAE